MDHTELQRLRKITPEQAANSIYIDFEGEGRSPVNPLPMPHMLGAYWPKTKDSKACYMAYMFHKDWIPVANGCGGEVADLAGTISRLAQKARRQGGFLIYFSDHERKVLEHHLPAPVYEEFISVAFNAKPPVDRMYNRTHPRQTASRPDSLAAYASFYFPHFNQPEVGISIGDACRRIDATASLGLRWNGWPEPRKKLARKLVHYNRVDCILTWKLTKKLANHLGPNPQSQEAA